MEENLGLGTEFVESIRREKKHPEKLEYTKFKCSVFQKTLLRKVQTETMDWDALCKTG